MTDWNFAIQIAAGGFGMVFLLLTVLAIMVSAGARLIARAGKKKAEGQS
jgi:Na+-transporting methylmalonyl-CoA/oxaloacetate decarboxylase gamma subunit